MATKPRSIFQDVGSAPKPVAAPGGIDARGRGARRSIRNWLVAIFVLTACIIAVGGMTRLTDSGLSITEWNPISGAIPPLTATDWQAEFAAYQGSPEYQLQNKGMTLEQFKYIFWWEWGHRQLARTIGMVWLVGFVYFWASRRIPAGWTGRLFGIGVLIGTQSVVGWWMVSSGLKGTMLDVASYRLATHLGLAFVVFGFAGWFIFLLGRREADLLQARRQADPRLFGLGTGLLTLGFVQIILGALVAGIDAGRNFPHWPTMDGTSFLPPDPFVLVPLWRNFFEDAGLVQFIHRMSGYVLFLFGVTVWAMARRSPNRHTVFAFDAVLGMLVIQMTLGIFTALYSAPLQIAIVHQAGAVVLWVLILRARYLARYPIAQTIRGSAQ